MVAACGANRAGSQVNQIVWAHGSLADNPGYAATAQALTDITSRRLQANVVLENGKPSFMLFGNIGCNHWSRSFEWPWAFDVAELNQRDVVLEAGGGDTEFQMLLARYARTVINIDHNQAPLDSSELFARSLGVSNLLCRRSDLAEICYPDAHFDKVFCLSVVEHISHAEKCIDELWRVLKPGGRLILTMDIVEKEQPKYLFSVERAQQLVSRWSLQVPSFPADGLTQILEEVQPATGAKRDNKMAVLCVQVEKP